MILTETKIYDLIEILKLFKNGKQEYYMTTYGRKTRKGIYELIKELLETE